MATITKAADLREDSRVTFTLDFEDGQPINFEGIVIGANRNGDAIIRYMDGSVGIVSDDFIAQDIVTRISVTINGYRRTELAAHGQPPVFIEGKDF